MEQGCAIVKCTPSKQVYFMFSERVSKGIMSLNYNLELLVSGNVLIGIMLRTYNWVYELLSSGQLSDN